MRAELIFSFNPEWFSKVRRRRHSMHTKTSCTWSSWWTVQGVFSHDFFFEMGGSMRATNFCDGFVWPAGTFRDLTVVSSKKRRVNNPPPDPPRNTLQTTLDHGAGGGSRNLLLAAWCPKSSSLWWQQHMTQRKLHCAQNIWSSTIRRIEEKLPTCLYALPIVLYGHIAVMYIPVNNYWFLGAASGRKKGLFWVKITRWSP